MSEQNPENFITNTQETDNSSLPQDFETAIKQLETLVEKMESGQLPLEESLALYEKGIKLTRICKARLEHVEQQIQVLQSSSDESEEG